MQRWHYLVLEVSDDSSAKGVQDKLTSLGLLGWELVTSSTRRAARDTHTLFHFKRSAPEEGTMLPRVDPSTKIEVVDVQGGDDL